ncbi:beta-1,3-galactosyltransferase 4-like [Sycon ciliatum]|uniref:beta-1,3-galactosyltransferase 4-like n=1 Tax=Sycon ciliatum TaxID=27933 RepID=UPI0020AB75AA|eukprot:scpid58804/ scgid30657/ Beta-1,3-galactosyltransferase 1; UDP-Gal:betaGlcNAc beta 1,3-galactosyltransferase-I; UDP-galactose:beta-N-acetyl-glucosamine-beta-1,3-galactosyltransferase 1 &gt; Beta-1,3-galactosyltransferase 1; UDP-galactose:beta-N-acetyl-glucosamine-beta-1,3-galactosyltransferase 1 &gt; Beta-1,3-galactosyltransferase 1; UDP-galactose:beta-N-acetyl-glucosamine-beta-1,3-galactosyltransferase 1 &gt; Beta-1,3-galactosyltransferase 1; UDP-galactose:beta-N-acetyl-glucosamine-beta-1,3-gala
MPGLVAKRWCRLLVILGLVILSLLLINSQLQVSEANGARSVDRSLEYRLSNGANLAVKSELDDKGAHFEKQPGDSDSLHGLPPEKLESRQYKESDQHAVQHNPDIVVESKNPPRPPPPGPHLPPGALFVVVLILSETPDAPHRRAVRNSWARKLTDYQVDRDGLVAAANREGEAFTTETLYRHFFIVGRLAGILDYVRAEMEKERDVVMVNENDYASTSAKLYSALMWAKMNLEFEYVLKTQDKVFLNVPGMIQWVAAQPRKRLYAGNMVHLARIMKKKRSPWYMADKFYQGKFYPDYLQSFAFIMSHDTVELLLNAWRGSLTAEIGLLHIDDLDVGIAMKNYSISPVHCPHFYKGFSTQLCKNPQVLAVGEVPRDKLQVLGENSLRGRPSC